MRRGACERLRSGNDQEFAAAYWELFLHEVLLRLEYDIRCEVEVGGGRNIDFLVSRGGESMYIEATIAAASTASQAANARRNRLYRALDGVRSSSFMIGVEIRSAGPGDVPNLNLLRTRIEEWLAGLTPTSLADVIDGSGVLPSMEWKAAGWELVIEAFQVHAHLRGGPVDRPLGMYMDETGGRIDDETRLRRALKRKAASTYGSLDQPFVIAVNEHPWEFTDFEWHRTNVMYGTDAVAFGDGQPARSVRRPDGHWRGPGQRPRNRRLSAVLFGARVYPWQLQGADLEWWANPFALSPVSVDLLPEVARMRSLEQAPDGGRLSRQEPRLSLETLLGF